MHQAYHKDGEKFVFLDLSEMTKLGHLLLELVMQKCEAADPKRERMKVK